jgi:hypothetical protein
MRGEDSMICPVTRVAFKRPRHTAEHVLDMEPAGATMVMIGSCDTNDWIDG